MKKYQNKGISTLLIISILLILFVLVGGGLGYTWLLKQKQKKIPETKAPEKITKYPRASELFEACFKSYSPSEQNFPQEPDLTEEEKQYLREYSEVWQKVSVISDKDIEKIFKEGVFQEEKISTPEDFERTLEKDFADKKGNELFSGIFGWGGISFLCKKNLMDIDLRPPAYDRRCEEKPDCCDLPELKDIDSIKEFGKKLSECIEPNFEIENIEKLKYGYLLQDGWAHVEAVKFNYYLTDKGCIMNCYFPYMYLMSIKMPLIEKEMKRLEFEKLPEEIKTKVKEFENKIESLKEKAISDNNPELCEEIKSEVRKVEAAAEEKKSGWEYEVLERKSAFRYEDEYYQPCIKIIAVTLNDESLCDKMPSPAYCREEIFLQYTDLCEEIAVDIKAKEEYCSSDEEEKRELCMSAISNIRKKEQCVMNIALETGDSESCDKIPDCQRIKESIIGNTYKNEEYGYGLDYPRTWIPLENKQSYCPSVALYDKNWCYETRFVAKDNRNNIILIIHNPTGYIGPDIENMEFVRLEQMKIRDTEYFLEKHFYVPQKGIDKENMIFTQWIAENLGRSGEMIMFYKDENDENLKIFNYILSTFRFLE